MEISLAHRARAPASSRGGIFLFFFFFHISVVSSLLFRLLGDLFGEKKKLNVFTFFPPSSVGGFCLNLGGGKKDFPVTEKNVPIQNNCFLLFLNWHSVLALINLIHWETNVCQKRSVMQRAKLVLEK